MPVTLNKHKGAPVRSRSLVHTGAAQHMHPVSSCPDQETSRLLITERALIQWPESHGHPTRALLWFPGTSQTVQAAEGPACTAFHTQQALFPLTPICQTIGPVLGPGPDAGFSS